jgi:hypothetical protein
MAHGEELRRRVCSVLAARKDPEEDAAVLSRLEKESGEFWIAVDANNEAMAFAVVIVDMEAANLAYVISSKRDNQSDARYLLSAEIFTDLARRQVRYVLSACPLFISDGLVYFERLLGFQPMNVTVRQCVNAKRWSA